MDQTVLPETDTEGGVGPFLLAEKAELLVGRIYDRLAELYAGYPDLQQMFLQLAEEEREHASRIRLFARMWHQEGHEEAPNLNEPRVVLLIEHGEAFLKSLDNAEPMEPGYAAHTATKIENDFGAIHAECMAAAKSPKLADFFGQLSEGDYMHAALLARARKDFKFDGSA
jgi:rubrerythrin